MLVNEYCGFLCLCPLWISGLPSDKVDCPQLSSHFLVALCLKLPDSCVCVSDIPGRVRPETYFTQVHKCWRQCIASVESHVLCSCDTVAVTIINTQGTHKADFKCVCYALVKLWHTEYCCRVTIRTVCFSKYFEVITKLLIALLRIPR